MNDLGVVSYDNQKEPKQGVVRNQGPKPRVSPELARTVFVASPADSWVYPESHPQAERQLPEQ